VFLYEVSDLKFSLVGVGFLLANLLFACSERVLQRHFLAVRAVDVSKPALMVLNNGVGALLILFVLLIESYNKAPREEEFHRMRVALTRHPLNAGSALAASCLVGCAISYAGLWLQRLVTATSFMVLGCVTKMVVLAWGVAFHGDSHGPLSIFGALLSIGGGYAYSRLK